MENPALLESQGHCRDLAIKDYGDIKYLYCMCREIFKDPRQGDFARLLYATNIHGTSQMLCNQAADYGILNLRWLDFADLLKPEAGFIWYIRYRIFSHSSKLNALQFTFPSSDFKTEQPTFFI